MAMMMRNTGDMEAGDVNGETEKTTTKKNIKNRLRPLLVADSRNFRCYPGNNCIFKK